MKDKVSCKHCNTNIDSDLKICPYCGHRMSHEYNNFIVFIILMVIIIIVIFGLILKSSNYGHQVETKNNSSYKSDKLSNNKSSENENILQSDYKNINDIVNGIHEESKINYDLAHINDNEDYITVVYIDFEAETSLTYFFDKNEKFTSLLIIYDNNDTNKKKEIMNVLSTSYFSFSVSEKEELRKLVDNKDYQKDKEIGNYKITTSSKNDGYLTISAIREL